MNQMKRRPVNIEIDLLRLHMLLPQTKIIWSEILQRRYWHTAISGKAIEKWRKRVNLAVRNIVSSIQRYAIRHQNISAKEINSYRNDGTHLSDIGLRVYNRFPRDGCMPISAL
jgi:hypothetical protein